MARINLLPWRQEERERRNKEFNVLAVVVAAMAIVAVLVAMTYLNRDLSNQLEANQLIVDQNTQLDVALKEIEGLEQQRDEMVARMKVIQDLQGRRSVPVRIWDDIARAVPPAMYLTSMKREGDTITLVGYADNNTVVTQLVSNLDRSPWLADSRIPQITTTAGNYQQGGAPISAREGQVRPEDNYIQFTVTTQVKPDEIKLDGSANPIVDSGQGSQIPADMMVNDPMSANQATPATDAQGAPVTNNPVGYAEQQPTVATGSDAVPPANPVPAEPAPVAPTSQGSVNPQSVQQPAGGQ